MVLRGSAVTISCHGYQRKDNKETIFDFQSFSKVLCSVVQQSIILLAPFIYHSSVKIKEGHMRSFAMFDMVVITKIR